MSGLVRSVRWLSLAQASKVIGQLANIVVLAHILPPSAYGVMAMAGVATAFLALLRDLGTGAAIIQRKTLTPSLADTVFLLNVAFGTFLGILLAGLSLPIANVFQEPQLTGVLLALAVTFPIGSTTAVHQALMERQSRFKELAILDVVTQLSGLILSILAALLGAGVFSFVIPVLFATCVTSVWLWNKSGFKAGRNWSSVELKSLWGFSGNLTLFNFVNYFARNVDTMIVGRMLGSTALGQYGMAYKLMLFPVQHMSWVLSRALLPRMSSLHGDLVAIRTLYFRVLGAIALVSAPLMLGLWALREPFVSAVLNERWVLVPDLLGWLAPVGLMQSFMSTVGSVLTAQGKTGFLLKLGIINTAIILGGLIGGAAFGVIGVAAGYFFANAVNLTLNSVIIGRTLEAKLRTLLEELKAPISSAAVMVIVLVSAIRWHALDALPPIFRLVMLALLGVAVYVAVLAIAFNKSPRLLVNTIRGSE